MFLSLRDFQAIGKAISSLRKRRPTELALYVLEAVLILATLFGLLAAGMSWDFFIRWIGLGLMTALLFGYWIKAEKRFWKKRNFWLLAVTLLVVHIALWASIIKRTDEWNFGWFQPAIFEIVVFAYVTDIMLRRTRRA